MAYERVYEQCPQCHERLNHLRTGGTLCGCNRRNAGDPPTAEEYERRKIEARRKRRNGEFERGRGEAHIAMPDEYTLAAVRKDRKGIYD